MRTKTKPYNESTLYSIPLNRSNDFEVFIDQGFDSWKSGENGLQERHVIILPIAYTDKRVVGIIMGSGMNLSHTKVTNDSYSQNINLSVQEEMEFIRTDRLVDVDLDTFIKHAKPHEDE